MNDYNNAAEFLHELHLKVASEGTLQEKIAYGNALATLSLSQEISALNPQNTTSFDEDGNRFNGWGTAIPNA